MNTRQKKTASLERTARRTERATEKDGKNSISCHGTSAPKNEPIPVYIISQNSADVKTNDDRAAALDDLDDEIRDVIRTFDRLAKRAVDACEMSIEADVTAAGTDARTVIDGE